jgi:light-regulated signal transduction histidine kinase (bacteriophytochrome)
MTAPAEDLLQQCAREPIRFSGAIQPHGYLVSCRLSDWTIRHVSANVGDLLGTGAVALVGDTLREHLPEDLLRAIADTVGYQEGGGAAQRVSTATLGPGAVACEISVHVAEDLVHLEIEPVAPATAEKGSHPRVQAVISGLGEHDAGFLQRVAAQVRATSGYARVMVYRFREDESGEVIAESLDDGMEAYLGLRYPASDIPPQARALYLKNRIRVIPDAAYVSVPIVPPAKPDGLPLDLGHHALRSVSPVHLEYLRNMGVAASMSISIISGGRLWGLVACHHPVPRRVPASTRALLELLGTYVSMRVAAAEQESAMEGFERAEQIRDSLRRKLAGAGDFDAALGAELDMLREALRCDGAALWLGSRWLTVGATPDPRLAPELLEWLSHGSGSAEVVSSDRAAEWRSPLVRNDEIAGVMGLCLGGREDWLLLFRKEQVHDVTWAGEPAKAMVPTDDGIRIAPRRSFASWREQVRGRSLPWNDADHRAGERLHRLLHESRRLARAGVEDLAGLEDHERKRRLLAQRERLSNLSQLLEGLVHLDPAATRSLEQRIALFDAEMRELIRRPLAPALNA